jgi:hypothetical protein
MKSNKRKPAKRGRKNSPATQGPRSRRRSPAAAVRLPAELPVRQGLVEMATIGAQSFLWLATLVVIGAVLAGVAFGIWSLRPVPGYASERVTLGSAFAVTFRIENTSDWFALAHLKIRCVVDGIDAPDLPPVEADLSRIPERLEPGAQATFTCPFRAADPEVAQRSKLYFRSEYDLPLGSLGDLPVLGRLRLGDNRGPFVLDTRLLPPRWTAKPGKD